MQRKYWLFVIVIGEAIHKVEQTKRYNTVFKVLNSNVTRKEELKVEIYFVRRQKTNSIMFKYSPTKLAVSEFFFSSHF